MKSNSSVLVNTWCPGCSTTTPGHPVQLTNTKTGACFDWAVVTVVSASPATSQGDGGGGGVWEIWHCLSKVLVRSSASVDLGFDNLKRNPANEKLLRSSVSRPAVSCVSPHASTEVGVRSHAGWEEESGPTTSVCSFTAKWRACSFPSVFPPPPSGSWLIPHRITMVLCTSSSPLSLPCTKRK